MTNESNRGKQLFRWITGILFWMYLTALFTGTHLPPKEVDGIVINDKLLHFGAYLGLAFLWLAWRFSYGSITLLSYVICVLVLAFYGAFDEVTQLMVGRNANMIDWYADVAGVIAGCHCFWVIHSLHRIVNQKNSDADIQSTP